MLVLTRKKGEAIWFAIGGENVKVTLLDSEKNRARIGVEANVKVAVTREEVWSPEDKEMKGEAHEA
jgi:carbon storage regulator CsrA